MSSCGVEPSSENVAVENGAVESDAAAGSRETEASPVPVTPSRCLPAASSVRAIERPVPSSPRSVPIAGKELGAAALLNQPRFQPIAAATSGRLGIAMMARPTSIEPRRPDCRLISWCEGFCSADSAASPALRRVWSSTEIAAINGCRSSSRSSEDFRSRPSMRATIDSERSGRDARRSVG